MFEILHKYALLEIENNLASFDLACRPRCVGFECEGADHTRNKCDGKGG
jgi:hypothetical protein